MFLIKEYASKIKGGQTLWMYEYEEFMRCEYSKIFYYHGIILTSLELVSNRHLTDDELIEKYNAYERNNLM